MEGGAELLPAQRLRTMKEHANAAARGDTVAVKYACQRFVTATQLMYGR